MAEDNPLDKLRVAKETEYFRKQEEALLRELRRRAALADERKQLADATRIDDERVLQDLAELGFHRDTAILLPILPLVEIAWAEGGVSGRERRLIIELAHARGVQPDTPAYSKLSEWLSVYPGDDFFTKTREANARMIAALPADQREAAVRDLASQSKHVAEASGGFFGLGKISPEEARLIDKIVAELRSGGASDKPH
jgi:hypothetical protein